MALIVITIKDQPDGSVSVQLTDEPACTPDQKDFTPAQHIGAIALNAVDKEIREPKVFDPTSQKLIVVGADGQTI
ncbi:hypothetical protein RGU70_13760 [Herbaspirillum sp. RTI4]|uniref:hypothetical protein n=1 Tax=Herbaspirillum sp. RTI4 TaxID=3048640 RepID=UPI002AB59D85|nr:hypothetical protein [Herbaspirillum sp. RTI4]MDY7579380.1 hypothetical protein [Herbaspirillum sp. RTI4]MEA9980294.1 hypothetical protein [Herbaspirillum sp. RTI4]